jgi:hypothetical protein
MIKLNVPQKNRAEQRAVISQEKQTLLSKKREKLQPKLNQARLYFELTLNYIEFTQRFTSIINLAF